MGNKLTPPQIRDLANDLARELYAIRGYCAPEGYRFDRATHPHEVESWSGACAAFALLRDTDVDDAISEIDEAEDDD